MTAAKPRVVAVIQARTGSSRLPGKVLLPIGGRPLIAYVIERVKAARTLHEIVLATSTQPEDAPLVAIAEQLGIQAFTGSETDVLDRMHRAATAHRADIVVRITGDCPFVVPELIDRLVARYLEQAGRLDYVSLSPEWPEGFDIEVFSSEALAQAWREAKQPSEREHVTTYIIFSGKFRTERLPAPADWSSIRLVVDEPVDLQVVECVFAALASNNGNSYGLDGLMAIIQAHPELLTANQHVRRNEGYLISRKRELRTLASGTRSLAKSEAYWRRATRMIPAGAQTFSKGPTQYVQGVAPKYLQRAQGCRVWDVDGNEYIDYAMGLGPVILGHNHPRVVEAVQRQLADGVSFSLMHPLEVEMAEALLGACPWAQMVRFAKNGSDVTTAAVRAARAYTQRDLVLHCGYHGWHDWYIGSTTRNAGVPQATINLQRPFPYNDLPALERLLEEHRGRVAAVIMEPFGVTEPSDGYLQAVGELTRRHGAVWILDEVASGFRFRYGGIHADFGVEPDLICFGKALANGFPLSALAGRAEIMRVFEEAFFSFTFGGECLSLAAGLATLQEMREQDIFPHLWAMGRRLQEGLNRFASDLGLTHAVRCVGRPPRTVVTFQDPNGRESLLMKSLFQQEVLKRGVLFGGFHCLSYAHQEMDIDLTLGAYLEALEILADGLRAGRLEQLLEGEPVQPVFRTIA